MSSSTVPAFNTSKPRPSSQLPVLVVDDEPVIIDLLCELLEEHGFEVLWASNGQAGLYVVQQTPLSLVLTDFMMPELNGMELARQIRADSRTYHLPLLLMSAVPPQNTEALFAAVIRKPFVLEDVTTVVQYWSGM